MADPAYIRLTPDGYWALFWGDGTETTPHVLAVGRPFESGPGIRDAVAELEAWAAEAGFDVITPHYSLEDVELSDLIEPEVYDDLFNPEAPDEQE